MDAFDLPVRHVQALSADAIKPDGSLIAVGPTGVMARFPVYEAVYWTGRVKIDPPSGQSVPDLRRQMISAVTQGVSIIARKGKDGVKTEQLDLTGYCQRQMARGWIRVDHIIGPWPMAAIRNWAAYAKYANQILEPANLRRLMADGWQINQGLELAGLADDILANTRGHRTDDIDTRRAIAESRRLIEAGFQSYVQAILGAAGEASEPEPEVKPKRARGVQS